MKFFTTPNLKNIIATLRIFTIAKTTEKIEAIEKHPFLYYISRLQQDLFLASEYTSLPLRSKQGR